MLNKQISTSDKRQKKQNHKVGYIVAILLASIWMAFIFYLSNQPASISAATSLSIIKTIFVYITPVFNVENHNLDFYNEIFRTFMHGFMFFILAVLVHRPVRMRLGNGFKSLCISILICAAYALVDEVHQFFVPGRAFQLSDILVDLIGVLLGVTMYQFFILLKTKLLNIVS